jgi:hypothetical protein
LDLAHTRRLQTWINYAALIGAEATAPAPADASTDQDQDQEASA